MSAALRTVSDDELEIRLDRWFRRHFPGLTQGAIEKLCRTGQVRVNGGRVSAATRLLPGAGGAGRPRRRTVFHVKRYPQARARRSIRARPRHCSGACCIATRR